MPDTTSFATKPALASAMIDWAIDTGVPFAWVAADSVYGVSEVEKTLRRAGKGFVLGVNSNHWFGSWSTAPLIAGEAKDIAQGLPVEAWQRLSAGCLPLCSNTIRTARLRTSGANLLLVLFVMTPSSQDLKPPANSARFKSPSREGAPLLSNGRPPNQNFVRHASCERWTKTTS